MRISSWRFVFLLANFEIPLSQQSNWIVGHSHLKPGAAGVLARVVQGTFDETWVPGFYTSEPFQNARCTLLWKSSVTFGQVTCVASLHGSVACSHTRQMPARVQLAGPSKAFLPFDDSAHYFAIALGSLSATSLCDAASLLTFIFLAYTLVGLRVAGQRTARRPSQFLTKPCSTTPQGHMTVSKFGNG